MSDQTNIPSDELREAWESKYGETDWDGEWRSIALAKFIEGWKAATHHSASTITRLEQEIQRLRGAAKNCDYHADQLKYVMAGGFSKEEQLLMLENVFTAIEDLQAPTTSDTKGEI